jgi:hypothetical protein
MIAKFMLQGTLFSVWTLDQEGSVGDEVRKFLEDLDDASRGNFARALFARIRYMADTAPANLTREIRDCWEENGERFCELKKDPWRISYYVYGNERRILLATVFRKHGMKAKKEYGRSLGLFAQFRQSERWERRQT